MNWLKRLICRWLGHKWGPWVELSNCGGWSSLFRESTCERCGCCKPEPMVIGEIDRAEWEFWRNAYLPTPKEKNEAIADLNRQFEELKK